MSLNTAQCTLFLLVCFVHAYGGTLEPGEYSPQKTGTSFNGGMRFHILPVTGNVAPSWSMSKRGTAKNDDDPLPVPFQCTNSGDFPVPGSCKEFFRCEKQGFPSGEYIAHLLTCPLGTVFSHSYLFCVSSIKNSEPNCSMGNDLRESQEHPQNSPDPWSNETQKELQALIRTRRFDSLVFLKEAQTVGSIASTASNLFLTGLPFAKIGQGGVDLRAIEYKLTGIEGRLNNVSLSVLETQLANKIRAEVMGNLINQEKSNIHGSFDMTQRLINKGILDDHISTAVQQGLIINKSTYSKSNFVKVQVSVHEVENFIDKETTEAMTTLGKGFESVLPATDLSQLEPIVFKLLEVVRSFRDRLDHLQVLPESSWKAEIEESMGFLHYLESNSLETTLRHIIQQNLVFPKTKSDLPDFFMLDLLVDTLQIHSSMLSSVVSSLSLLASKALENTKLDQFNAYIQQILQTVSKVKISFGYDDRKGFIEEVKELIPKIDDLSFSYRTSSLRYSLNQRSLDVMQVEFNTKKLILDNQELEEPEKNGIIPDFSTSSLRVPVGPWRTDKRVMYAVQFASEKGLSLIGEWSVPYTVNDKACPVISLPRVESGIIRLLYRKFDEQKPELVAIVRDHLKVSVRDIGRDIINAAATPNDQAIKDIEALAEQPDVDINISIEYEMTPLHYAAKYGNLNVMDVLISKNADIHTKAFDDKEPLHFSAIYGSRESLEYLIGKGAEVNAKTKLLGLSPLHLSVANNHAEATETLVRRNAFVNQRDNKGLTPLHISVASDGDAADVLLRNVNIDVNAVAGDGLTPLHYAARCYNEIYVITLLDHPKTHVNATNSKLVTPLHLVAMVGNVHIIGNLYDKDASVSAVDEHGHTAIHYAAFYGNTQAAFILKRLDSSLEHVKDVQGRTALDLAIQYNKKGFIDILNNNAVGLTDALEEEFSTDALTVEQNLKSTVITLQQQNSPDVPCNSSVADELAAEAVNVCLHVTNVDSYVTLVMEMVPLSVYYEDQPKFSSIFRDYDYDLQKAKNNSNLWRNGDSIVKGISRTFELAREFEPEFRRKYEINKKRVQKIEVNADQVKIIEQFEADIAYLEEKKQNMSKLIIHAQMDMLKSFLESEISNLDGEIGEKKQMLKNDFTLMQELEELAAFLEFVRRDSVKIQSVANATKGKLEIFRGYLEQDKGAFERHGEIAKETLKKLEDDTIKANQSLAEYKKRIEKLEGKIEEKNKDIRNKYKKIEEDFKELNSMHREILDKIDRGSLWGNLLKVAGGIVSIFEPVSGLSITAAGEALAVTSGKIEQKMQLLRNMADTNRENVKAIEADIKVSTREISRLRGEMMNSKNITQSLRNELRDFGLLDDDLKNMTSKTNGLVDAIDKALVGINVLKGIFDEITLKLEEMIELSKTAKTEAERRNTKFFIYEELSLLECNWNDVYIKVGALDRCTKYYKDNVLD